MALRTQRNPWDELPNEPPFVLPSDAQAVLDINSRIAPDKRLDLTLLPEPFFGRESAPVLSLALNPGWSPDDADVHRQKWFTDQSRRSLSHQLAPYPFLHLQPGSAVTPGARWWQRITSKLVATVGFEAVATGLQCVEFFPYHSLSFSAGSLMVPSQSYGFHLVRRALDGDAEVVVMRSWRLWSRAVPELSTYRRLHRVGNPRNPSLSPKNLGEAAFDAVRARLERGY